MNAIDLKKRITLKSKRAEILERCKSALIKFYIAKSAVHRILPEFFILERFLSSYINHIPTIRCACLNENSRVVLYRATIQFIYIVYYFKEIVPRKYHPLEVFLFVPMDIL